MMTLDLLIINFNQKINLVSGMSQLPMSGRTVFSSFSKIDQLKIFLHDLIGGEIRDGTRPGPRHHPSLGRVRVASHSILQSPIIFPRSRVSSE